MTMMMNVEPTNTAATSSSTSTSNTAAAAINSSNNGKACLFDSSLAKIIALNHAGIACMESNRTDAAVNIFSAAFTTHEKLKTKLQSANRKRQRSCDECECEAANAVVVAGGVIMAGGGGAIGGAATTLTQQQPQCVRPVSLSSSPTSDAIATSSLSSPPSSSLGQHTRKTINVDDLFVRVPIHHQSSNGVHDTTGVFHDLIRLPSLEELPLLVARKALSSSLLPDDDEDESDESDYEDLVRQDSNEDSNKDYSIIGGEEESNTFGFLSTCHVFNLAILHHLRGFELFCANDVEDDDDDDEHILEKEEEEESKGGEEEEATATETVTTSTIRRHLDRAGHLYELTMRLERTRSENMCELEQQQQQQQQQQGQYRQYQIESQPVLSDDNINDNSDNELGNNISRSNESSHHVGHSNSDWFSPKIVLACINNLAHLHDLMNNTNQSQRCYRQLRSTVTNMWLRRRQQEQLQQQRIDMMVPTDINTSSSNDDSGNGNDNDNSSRDEDYVQFFWLSAYRGLLQHHLVSTSSTATTISSSANESMAVVAAASNHTTDNSNNSNNDSRITTRRSPFDSNAAAA
jgi:hypothetical protein